eukprot:g56488.t1
MARSVSGHEPPCPCSRYSLRPVSERHRIMAILTLVMSFVVGTISSQSDVDSKSPSPSPSTDITIDLITYSTK